MENVKNVILFVFSVALFGMMSCESDLLLNKQYVEGDHDSANHMINMEVPHEISFASTIDTTMNVKFHIGRFSDSENFVVVPVDFTRIDGVLMAKDNDQIDISYIKYKGQSNVLTIALDNPDVEAKGGGWRWVWVDMFDDAGNFVRTCEFYCNFDDAGDVTRCCQDAAGNCVGLGPNCHEGGLA